MNLQEIKQAIQDGKTVHWANESYQVIKDNKGEYLIKCTPNGSCIGLTWQDEKTLNGDEKDFYIVENSPKKHFKQSLIDLIAKLDKDPQGHTKGLEKDGNELGEVEDEDKKAPILKINFTESDLEEMTSRLHHPDSGQDGGAKVFDWEIDNINITITVGEDEL